MGGLDGYGVAYGRFLRADRLSFLALPLVYTKNQHQPPSPFPPAHPSLGRIPRRQASGKVCSRLRFGSGLTFWRTSDGTFESRIFICVSWCLTCVYRWVGIDWSSTLLPNERASWCSPAPHLVPLPPPITFVLPGFSTHIDKTLKIRRRALWRWVSGPMLFQTCDLLMSLFVFHVRAG